jgi:hypothetical protein
MGAILSSNHHLCKQCSRWSFPKTFIPSASQYEYTLRDYRDPNAVDATELPLTNFQKKNCLFCTFILRLFSQHPECAKATNPCVYLRADNYGKYSSNKSDWKYIRQLDVSANFIRAGHRIQICDGTVLCGRTIKNDIDMGVIEQWLCLCESHEKCLIKSTRVKMRVIDATDERVCYAVGPKYAALSYTWGPPSITQLKLTKQNEESLFSPGGIRDAPTTIRDAVEVCKRLGIRYLWVDALCIFQDGSGIKEINDMDKIYSRAYITIVCASGNNSWASLPGVNPDTRNINQKIQIIDGLPLSTVQPSFQEAMKSTTWSTRGWTFQEGVLSSRLLIFTDSQVFYQCNTALWCEDTVLETTDEEVLELYGMEWGDPLERLLLNDRSSVHEYTRFVQQYALRQFTYPSDVARAMAGILELLSKFMHTDFFACLPERYFDYALLFSLRSRSHIRNPDFPSWSWTGWISANSGINLTDYKEHRMRSKISWFRIKENKVRWIPNVGINGVQDYSQKAVPEFDLPDDLQKAELDKLLIFETSTILLPVSFWYNEPPYNMDTLEKDFAISFPLGTKWIYLDPIWRQTQGLYLEFILIVEEGEQGFQDKYKDFVYTMLIETDTRGV